MNILLCVIHALDSKFTVLPTGIGFISAVLKKNSFTVYNFVWDMSRDDIFNVEQLKEKITSFNIDAIMCGAMVNNYTILRLLFESAKKDFPQIYAIQGGCFVSYSPDEAMTLIPECDCGVIGEGEITICELMDALVNKKDISAIKGIVYRDDLGEIKFTEKRNEKPDLASLPIPDHEGFFGEWLVEHNGFMITSGRGCNYSCTYCTKLENRYRERPLEKFFEELDYYVTKYKINRITILNEFFNVEPEYLECFLDKVKNYNLTITLQTRISKNLTIDVLQKLKDAGVAAIFFGLESADDTVLKSMRKGITAELIQSVLSDVKAAQINVTTNYIFGDTVETAATVNRTLEWAKNHRDLLHNLAFVMIRLYPGSLLYDKAVAEGKIDPITHIENQCPPVNVSRLSDDEYMYYNDYYFNYFYTTQIEIDLNIKNVEKIRISDVEYSFLFQCASCSKQYEITMKLKKQVGCSFFCDCGEKLVLECVLHLIDKNEIVKTIQNQTTAFYGIGRLFYRCYFGCELQNLPNEYFLLNSGSRSTIAAGDNRLTVLTPDAIRQFNIEKVIVTISGAYDVDCIISDLKESYPCTDFVMWYEYI